MQQAALGWALRAPLPRQHAKSCVSYASSCPTVATCVCAPDPPGRGRGAARQLRQAAACSKPRRGGLCELSSPDSTPSPASAAPAAEPWWRPAPAPPTRLVEVAALHGGCNKQPLAASRAGVGSASSAPQTARQVPRRLRLPLLRGGDLRLHRRPAWSRSRRCTAAAISSHMQRAAPGWALKAPLARKHARPRISCACSCSAVASLRLHP